MSFDPRDPSTWLPMLTLQQVAAIYQRPEGGVRKAAYLNRFQPAPAHRHPLRWRKVDVERDCDGGRGSLRRVG